MIENDEIKRFQDNLLIIRKAVGWSEEELGNQIGVTRQTINNLETQKSKLSKTQYIAMRAVLEKEIINSDENSKDTKMLVYLLETLIDNPEKYTIEDRKKIIEKANMLSPTIITKTNSRKDVSNDFVKIMEALGIVVGVAAGIVFFNKGKK